MTFYCIPSHTFTSDLFNTKVHIEGKSNWAVATKWDTMVNPVLQSFNSYTDWREQVTVRFTGTYPMPSKRPLKHESTCLFVETMSLYDDLRTQTGPRAGRVF